MDTEAVRLLLEMQKDMGKVLESCDNNFKFTQAVSLKAESVRLSLDKHETDEGAHGAGGSAKATDSFLKWLTLIIAIAAVAGDAYFHMKGH